jgi:murein DD-endopeptidase MepM/ murein hydrolase activator NlpD
VNRRAIEPSGESRFSGALSSLRCWFRSDDSLASRSASHLAILLLIAVVLTNGGYDLGNLGNPKSLRLGMLPQEQAGLVSWGTGGRDSPDYLTRGVAPLTIIPERGRQDVIVYAVQPGDNVWKIAQSFGLAPETIIWSNPELESWPDYIMVGQELFILPVDGAYHQVKAGETLQSIADRYSVDPSVIIECEYNDLSEPYELQAGERLVVPGGTRPLVPRYVQATAPAPANAPQGSGNFMWPVSGYVTQGYWSGHQAIDIGAPTGTPIYASDAGYVAAAGWMGGYGNYIVINHGNGFETLYAHLSQIRVMAGQGVQRGQVIGLVGSTGRSTGPHLHFEVRQGGLKRNPFGFLPRG